MRCFKLVLIFIMVIHTVHAGALTVDEAVQYALNHSEAVLINLNNSEILNAQAEQTISFVKPQMSILGSMATQRGSAVSELTDSSYSAGANISQLFFAGGRMWDSVKLKDNLKLQAKDILRSGNRDITEIVMKSFYVSLYRKALILITEDRLKQRQNEYEDARNLNLAGMVTGLDVRQAKVNVNKALDLLNESIEQQKESLIELNLVMGKQGDDEAPDPQGDFFKLPDSDQILTELDNRYEDDDFLDLQLLREQVDEKKLNYNMAAGEKFPEFSVFSTYSTDGFEIGDMEDRTRLGIRMNMSILDGGYIKQKKARYRSSILERENTYSKARRELGGNIERIREKLISLQERSVLQKEVLELSEQNYEDARKRYRAGTITLTQLGDFSLDFNIARFDLLRMYYLQQDVLVDALMLLEK